MFIVNNALREYRYLQLPIFTDWIICSVFYLAATRSDFFFFFHFSDQFLPILYFIFNSRIFLKSVLISVRIVLCLLIQSGNHLFGTTTKKKRHIDIFLQSQFCVIWVIFFPQYQRSIAFFFETTKKSIFALQFIWCIEKLRFFSSNTYRFVVNR